MASIPDTDTARRAERAGNRIPVPVPATPRLGLGEFVRETASGAGRDQLAAYAGNIAFRSLFAVFPLVIALLWLLHVVHADRGIDVLVRLVQTALPGAAAGPIRDQLTAAPRDQATGALTLGALLSLALALWAVSGAFRAIMDALNRIYGVEEQRPLLTRYALSLALAVGVLTLLLSALALVVGGEALATWLTEKSGLNAGVRLVWSAVGWAVMAVLVVTAFALTYYLAPDVEQRFRWVGSGSVVAVLLWLIFAAVFSFYINHLARVDVMYGALAGIAVLMLYVYGSAFILLLGAEMNQVIERRSPDGKDTGERRPRDGT
jgi:membrane protein